LIIVGANLLIYAYNNGSTRHMKARQWLEHALSGAESVGLPWQSIAAFLRIMSDPRLPGERLTVQQAVEVIESWLDHPGVRVLIPGDNHWILFRQMVIDGQAAGSLVSDAQIAALSIEYGGVLYTTDRDFARFPGLRWKNPLE
jgi:uncharacterized protein